MKSQEDLLIRYQVTLERVNKARCDNSKHEIALIAVSKKQPIEAIETLFHHGHRDFGENYVQELVEKAEHFQKTGFHINWHFIGHLQKNKINKVLPYLACLHTLDSESLAQALSNRLPSDRKFPVFIQINLNKEKTKSGITPEKAIEFSKFVSELPGLRLLGLMTIPDPSIDPRDSFSELKKLEVKCRPFTNGFLSMGMSSDFETAIEMGATHLRIGTTIFGARPTT